MDHCRHIRKLWMFLYSTFIKIKHRNVILDIADAEKRG